MYGKYTPLRTFVLDSHHYLISAQHLHTHTSALLHQILAGDHLPAMVDARTVQHWIGESENQNIVSESREGFEVYLDRNLVQVKLKEGVVLLS
jgi:hypothetical protein